MKRIAVMSVLVITPLAWAAAGTITAGAWFTDADLPGFATPEKPETLLESTLGTVGDGVRLTTPVAVDNPLLKQSDGYISFWIKPDWDGRDGKRHILMRVGDRSNGLLVEKSQQNMLRFVMASPTGSTASRADISGWKAGEWHHVVVAWFSKNEKPLGLPLWIDKVAVDGPIAGYTEFLNPDTLQDKSVWIGHKSSDCVIDELIFRNRFDTEINPNDNRTHKDMVAIVYRDYFRTAPYTKIKIDHRAAHTASDRRVVAGYEKQFGLQAEKEGKFEYVTEYAVRYTQWGEFDAKQFITWKTSDESIATVNKLGRVTGHKVGKCTLTATYRGMTDTYPIEVIPVEQPDLCLMYVERLPRYPAKAIKNNPEFGDTVTSVVHAGNFGYEDLASGVTVRFELIPDSNRNFELDDNEKSVDTREQKITTALAAGEDTTLEFKWQWPEEPMFVRVTLDPTNKVGEICEANNQRCELNIARPMHWGFHKSWTGDWHKKNIINHVGSFAFYDWHNAQGDRMNEILRDSVGPTTTPIGIESRIRSDYFYEFAQPRHPDAGWEAETKFFDGGCPVLERVDPMAIDAAIMHEFGHTCIALPDLYGYPIMKETVFLKDKAGEYYAGGPLLPTVNYNTLPLPSACNVPCDVGYNSLMNHCHFWLHPAHAGQVQYFRNFRGDRFWGVQGRKIPQDQTLLLYDINDEPLKNAEVFVYVVANTNAQNAGTKYFMDYPKFFGRTTEEGAYDIPTMSAKCWDDPYTDEVEGEYAVWNPFTKAEQKDNPISDIAFTPNVWTVDGLILIKICAGDKVEFAWLCLTDMNEAFYRGEIRGLYKIRTSLESPSASAPHHVPPMPPSVNGKNLRPIVKVESNLEPIAPGETFVVNGETKTAETNDDEYRFWYRFKPNQKFIFDASKSTDPEGAPLLFTWLSTGDQVMDRAYGPVYEGTGPLRNWQGKPLGPGIYPFYALVMDGIRCAKPARIYLVIEDEEK